MTNGIAKGDTGMAQAKPILSNAQPTLLMVGLIVILPQISL